MDSDQQLKQLLDPDLPSLGAYYRDLATFQGAGVLVVNYYPNGEVAQMSAKFLTPNQIPRLARQMGLPTLQVEFERHNQQSQMVVAAITAETKGVVTVELPSQQVQTALAQPPSPQGQTKRSVSSKRKSSAKSTSKQQDEENQTQAQTPEPETPVVSKSIAEAETVTQPTVESEAIPEASQKLKTTSKPAAKRKPGLKTQGRRKSPAKLAPKHQQQNTQTQEELPRCATSNPALEPETAAQPTVESEETTPQASLEEVEATSKPAALRKSDSKTSSTGKSTSKTTIRRKTATYASRTKRKKESQ